MGRTRQILTARTNTIEGLDTAGLWKRLFQSLAMMLVMWVALQPATADAQTCATPGKDGPGGTLTGIKNAYYPGTTQTLTAGTSTQIALGAANATGAQTAIANGDLLVIIQMQDATINVTNTSSYGDGTAGGGSGYSASNNTGRYEFIKATIAVPVTGGTLTFVGTGASSRLNNSYTNESYALPTNLQGQRRYQVVRVPQYTTATLSSTLSAAPWNGTTGGILAIDVAGVLAFGNSTAVSVTGLGFRPGAGRQLAGGNNGANTDYRNLASRNFHGSKGEGIAGTPRFMYIASSSTVLDNTDEGYTSGSTAMGAPGNAGGGGTDGHPSANDENSGGGGGGNGGTGGRGGNSWNTNLAVGGFGGSPFAQAAAGRLVMGGGGGAGTRNNTPGVTAASSGGAGGGMVIIRAGSVNGTATISATGADAFNDTDNDGGGGGGAGGSVVFWVKSGLLTGLTVNANGGRGGDAWHNQAPNGTPGERHGPGGGGGGGVVFVSTPALAISVAGGANGVTTSSSDAFSSAPGTAGISATNMTAAQIPGLSGGATCTLAASVVELQLFEATRYDGYVELQWQTGYEADNLGFNIYREENGQRQRVTKSLIAGSALMVAAGTNLTSGKSYSFWDATRNRTAQYWLEDLDLDGTSTWHGPIVAMEAPYGEAHPLQMESMSIETLGADKGEPDSTVPVGSKAKPVKHSAQLLLAQAAVAAQPAAKISVKQEGWYRVTQEELTAAGFNVASAQNLRLFADGQEQPFILNSEKGAAFSIEFYGLGIDTPWSDTRVYWLIAGGQPGAKIRTAQEVATSVASGSFQYTVERRDRNIYYSSLKNGDADNFFGGVVAAAGADQTLTLRSVDSTPGKDALIEVSVQGVTTLPHQVTVAVGGVVLGNIAFSGLDQGTGKFTVSQALLKEGENHVALTAQGGGSDVSLIGSIRVTYWHSYKADDSTLRFTANGKDQVTLDGFKSGDVRVMDVTSANAPQEVKATVTQQASGYSVTAVAPGIGKRTLLVFAGDGVKRAPSIRVDQPSSLKQKGNGADLVIITTQALSPSMGPLKALRQSQGMKVAVVDVEDIYDEFSFGQKTPQSVKDFLSYAKGNWSPAPRFVLLAGDATYDPRNYLGRGEVDLVPTKLVGTVQFETASDDWFADFDGDAIAEMAVGRLPVRTPEEAATVVGKIVGYDGAQATNSALLVNDLTIGYNFQQASQTVKSLIPAGLPVVQVDRVVMDDAAAKAATMDNLNRGPKVVNYLGHGAPGIWSNASLLTVTDAKSLRNRDHLSVYVMMTCLNGLYTDQRSLTLAGALIKSPDGGAVAVWASSGMTEAAGQVSLDQELFKYLFSGKLTTVGEAVMNAKAGTGDLDVRRTWIFFGDPSMKLR